MKRKLEKIELLKMYFQKNKEVLMAFLFGSRAKGLEGKDSDWDIGVYFKPKEYLELESIKEYKREKNLWSDLVNILETDNLDLVVLNRAKASVLYSALVNSLPIIIKNYKLYYDLLCKAGYEAFDWYQFVEEFYEISKKSKSLLPEAKTRIRERLNFLRRELIEIEEFKKLTFEKYRDELKEQRNVERWAENIVMATIDIAKIILASEKKEIPQGYRDTLKVFAVFYLNFNEKEADRFSEFAKLRNIIAHEYLDLKWTKIKKFIQSVQKIYPKLIKKVEGLLKK